MDENTPQWARDLADGLSIHEITCKFNSGGVDDRVEIYASGGARVAIMTFHEGYSSLRLPGGYVGMVGINDGYRPITEHEILAQAAIMRVSAGIYLDMARKARDSK